MAVGQKEHPYKLQTTGFSRFFLLPIVFFGYPVFLTHSQIVYMAVDQNLPF